MTKQWVVILAAMFLMVTELRAQSLPQFRVPGQETDMKTLEALHAMHHARAFTDCTLWDGWLPQSTLWVSPTKRQQYLDALSKRRIDESGYVAMQQHRGMAHSDGWPFPAWQQSTGFGFHFSILHEVWAIQNFNLAPLTSVDGWEIAGAEVLGISQIDGLALRVQTDEMTLRTPAVQCGTIVAPFLRLEWNVDGLPTSAQCEMQWQVDNETDWKADRSVVISRPSGNGIQYTNVPMYLHPQYAGLLKRVRLRVRGAKGAELKLKSLITAIDTRHPITNPLFVRACADTYFWTKDVEFLRRNLPRIRQAVRFAVREFDVSASRHVVVPWVGHDGRSGLVIDETGRKTLRPGVGVGNNYWDLLPFGAHDALATMYVYDALRAYVKLEEAVDAFPEWKRSSEWVAKDEAVRMADAIREDFQQRFWDAARGRFVGCIDRDGRSVDYGFTFLNLEAIHYGLASEEQAKTILEWIDGKRIVAEDTSQGRDIYRWRFAPRATTKRNIETYCWVWTNPESIPWGDQVQDGGAVLGFSYFDLMARLKTNGPDDAWDRLREILAWYREVETEGGYRAYYAIPGRGMLQGGGPPGGLGLDEEFLESVLVPQIMLYGFLGFEPTADGFRARPRLPSSWPSLTITGIHVGNRVIDLTAYPDGRIEERPHPETSE
ncbi:MAG: hypothetical protein ACK6A7_14025 [Planctomycetota bacterium]